MITQEIKGDVRDTDIPFIAHGVNCQGVMGSGVAKALYLKWPAVRDQYLQYHRANLALCIEGTEDFLGTVQIVPVDDGKTVLNMFTQDHYGYDGKLYLSYDAVRACFQAIVDQGLIKEIAIPRIGSKLAGGDWDKIKGIINDVTKDKIKITVYYI